MALDPHCGARRHEVAGCRGRRVWCGHPQQYTGAFALGVIGFAYFWPRTARRHSSPSPRGWPGRFAASFRSSSDWRRSSLWTLWCCGTGPSSLRTSRSKSPTRSPGYETDLDRQLRGPPDTGALLVYKPSAVGPRPVADAPRTCRHRVAPDAPGQARGGGRGLPDHLFPDSGPLDRPVHPLCDSAGARAGADGRHAERRVAAPASGRSSCSNRRRGDACHDVRLRARLHECLPSAGRPAAGLAVASRECAP